MDGALPQATGAWPIGPLVKILRELKSSNEELAKIVANEAEYFARNAHRMRYPAFRAQGLFIGPGVIEGWM